MKICISLGTRPEIIKMSPIIRVCKDKKLDYFILHSNQHYSRNLDEIFFEELDLPKPKYNLNIGSGTHGEQTGRMLIEIEKVFLKEKPDIVLVQGDTNTVLASALAAVKLHIKVGHVEAGLRSYFREMPEEINRVLADHCSDFLFAPTKNAESILIGEGIPEEKIIVTGNTVVDAVDQNKKLADKKSKVLKKLDLGKSGYILLTAHRPENVDKKDRLAGILEGLNLVYEKIELPIMFPIHPRTAKMPEEFKLKIPQGTRVIDPVGYLDFLVLETHSKLIMTDSGGIQEEACILQVPCVTLRDNTERLETVEVGGNILAGFDPAKILKSSEEVIQKDRNWENPFGDGRAGEKIVEFVLKNA